ncbi:MAG: glycosyltransferase family 39 protein, partial [Fischerella sp.]|nr:glycosyltransferase family 39 protein [Fischerella sp.]
GLGDVYKRQAIYCVNRVAFSKAAGLTAAMFMAISPFAVYLSQEARHYTLPMLLITLSLLGLVQIQQDIFQRQELRIWVWLAWTITNIIGLYIHYFCILAFIAEIGTLLILISYSNTWGKNNKSVIKTQSSEEFLSINFAQNSLSIIFNQRQIWLALIISIIAVAFSFLPWLPVLVSDYERPETDWIDPPSHIAPFYQTLIGWVLMLIALPVEKQSFFVRFISVLLMLFFGIWVGWLVYKKLKQMWSKQTTHLATITLLSFSSFILLEFFVIAYLLQKDITSVPRYNFVYYPGFCALISASLTKLKNTSQEATLGMSTKLKIFYGYLQNYQLSTIVIIGLISSIFVIENLVFLKPYEPEKVAQNMNQYPSMPLMVVVGYKNYQDVALGLSFALALERVRGERVGDWESGEKNKIHYSQFPSSDFAFFKQAPDFGSVWQKLAQLPPPTTNQLNLWVIAPGLKRRDYPQRLAFSQTTTCTKDTAQHYRVGIPYQLYRCGGE